MDTRTQGRSGDTDAELTYELMASDIAALHDQLGIDSTYIWGQSDGAILCLIIAKNYPRKVKKLVAFAANIIPDTTGIESPIYRWIERQMKGAKSEKERKLERLMWKYPNIPLAELYIVQAEVLVVSGDRDFVPLTHTLQIYQHLPKAQLCVIPGATHGASWEKKDLFLQIADAFLSRSLPCRERRTGSRNSTSHEKPCVFNAFGGTGGSVRAFSFWTFSKKLTSPCD